ncbi:uncharacterized protein LOC102042693 [Geospiza fortis]|uniref:Uncharacterized protein LOC102042693 n=1 Tax=Geospiza fortis TaxID=48883 RepID=A0A6I9HNC5_GEOFO|nr:uncharacterized protein LOC102042693 [Geospiza fortis]
MLPPAFRGTGQSEGPDKLEGGGRRPIPSHPGTAHAERGRAEAWWGFVAPRAPSPGAENRRRSRRGTGCRGYPSQKCQAPLSSSAASFALRGGTNRKASRARNSDVVESPSWAAERPADTDSPAGRDSAPCPATGPARSAALGSALFPKVQRLLRLGGRLTCVRSGCAVKKSSPGIVNEENRNKRLEQMYFLTGKSVYKVKLQR